MANDASKKVRRYNHQYWLENRAILLKQKKLRYQTDPAYRASVIKAAQESYARRRVGPKVEKAVVTWKGVTQPAFTIMDVARLLGISHDAVRRWIKQGKIPPPTCRAKMQWPMYPESKVKALCLALGEYTGPHIYPDDEGLQKKVLKAMGDA